MKRGMEFKLEESFIKNYPIYQLKYSFYDTWRNLYWSKEQVNQISEILMYVTEGVRERDIKAEEKYVKIDTPKFFCDLNFLFISFFSVLSSFYLSKDYISILSTKKNE